MYIHTDGPYIEEFVSDGELRILRWSTGLIQGFYSIREKRQAIKMERKRIIEVTKKDWKRKEFATWKEAEAWYKKGAKC